MTWFKNLFKSTPVNQFSSGDWLNEFKGDKNAVMIDVRSPGEFASGHIPKAINNDVFNGDFNSKIAQFDSNTKLYVYCRSGKRSMMACRKLYKLGFENLYNLQGGIMSYNGPIKK